jgi:hypothetical protein
MHLVPACDATAATVGQIRVLTVLLAKDREISLFVFDVGHDAIALGHELSGERVEMLCRIRDDRLFYDNPPPRPNRQPEGAAGGQTAN